MKLVGKVKEAHGLKGELYILVFSGDMSWLPKLKTFEISHSEIKSKKAILNLESFRKFKEGFILKTHEVKDRTQAEAYKGWLFSIDDELLVSKKGEIIYLSEILGFEVQEQEQSYGKIKSISTNGAQDLLVVESNSGEELLIPFVDAFIKKIDHDKKIVSVNLPEGLAEINKKNNSDDTESGS